MQLEFVKLKFVIAFTGDAFLPAFKGSMFRGGFGHALKKTLCMARRNDCPDCILNTTCLYHKFFSEKTATNETKLNPYILYIDELQRQQFSAGEELEFYLSLIGESARYIPYFIHAITLLGQSGIGQRRLEGYGRFFIEKVTLADCTIYRKNDTQVLLPENIPYLDCTSAMPSSGELQLFFDTPVRLKYKNKMTNTLPFHIFIRGLLRRITSLASSYGKEKLSLPYQEFITKSHTVNIVQSQVKWMEILRYSSRQQQKMKLGGLTGSISYHGEIGEYLPLIELGEHFHVGKQATFGLGHYSYTWTPDV